MTDASSAGRPGPDIFPENITCDNVHELRVGQIGTMKGKLEAVRFGSADLARRTCHKRNSDQPLHPDQVGNYGSPSLVIMFSDGGMLAVTLRDYHTAKGIPYPLSTYVAVKVQCTNEWANEGYELRALAIWELGSNPVPIALGEPFLERNALGVWVR